MLKRRDILKGFTALCAIPVLPDFLFGLINDEHPVCYSIVPNGGVPDVKNDKSSCGHYTFSDGICVFSQAIMDVLHKPGLIAVDLEDLKRIFKYKGDAVLGFGAAKKTVDALRKAISHSSMKKAIGDSKGLFFSIAGGTELSNKDVSEAAGLIYDLLPDEAEILFSACIKPEIHNETRVSIIATGISYK